MMEFAVLLLILGALALVVGPRLMARRGPRGQMVQGTLLVTGVSASKSGPDSSGQQSVTITGVINGPNVNEHVVYQQLFVDAGGAPTMGQLIPVVYAPNNPDKWFFAPSVEQQ
ncbi:MAG: hypothetical protein U0R66_00765 [Mycobacterium sp.]